MFEVQALNIIDRKVKVINQILQSSKKLIINETYVFLSNL